MIKLPHIPALALGLSFTLATGIASAQSAMAQTNTPAARVQIKMERDEFIRTHRWDDPGQNWVLMDNVDAPMGMKSRFAVRSDRDEFLSKNRWDNQKSMWVAMGVPRDLDKMSRDQMRREAQKFDATYHWDASTEVWVKKPPMTNGNR